MGWIPPCTYQTTCPALRVTIQCVSTSDKKNNCLWCSLLLMLARLHEVRGFFLLMLNIFRELNSCEKQLNNRQHLYPVDVPRPRGLTSAQVTSNREKTRRERSCWKFIMEKDMKMWWCRPPRDSQASFLPLLPPPCLGLLVFSYGTLLNHDKFAPCSRRWSQFALQSTLFLHLKPLATS